MELPSLAATLFTALRKAELDPKKNAVFVESALQCGRRGLLIL
jgi:hypothetical protein